MDEIAAQDVQADHAQTVTHREINQVLYQFWPDLNDEVIGAPIGANADPYVRMLGFDVAALFLQHFSNTILSKNGSYGLRSLDDVISILGPDAAVPVAKKFEDVSYIHVPRCAVFVARYLRVQKHSIEDIAKALKITPGHAVQAVHFSSKRRSQQNICTISGTN